MSIRFSCVCGLAVLVAITAGLSPNMLTAQKTEADARVADIEGRRVQLLALFDEEWQYELRTNPEMATGLGDNRYNDRLDDHSPEFYQSDVEARRKFLTRFDAIDPAGLSAQDSLSRELMIRNLRQDIEGARFKPWEMPVNQMHGPHLEPIELLTLTPFNSAKDYDDYVSRLHQIPKMFEQVTANMRQGMKDRLMQPRYLLEKVVAQAQQISDQKAEGSPFAKPVNKFPPGISEADQKLYSQYTRQMEKQLPKLFGRLPQNKLEVISMDPFRSKNAVPADYSPGASDGSRPGHINVNEWDPEHRLKLNIEAIAYHEGVPGHHLQISIAQELKDLPRFRQNGGYTAFVEGWALYSERLGKEIGFYEDPYSDYGRLENEMWRDIRLVIDTGVHEKHWSREKMVEYFHRYTAMDEPNVQSEVDRYIAWPGQALAYKLGQLEILRLREEARRKLGGKFDLHAFHDEVVGNGPLPLGVLHSHVEAWIADQGGGASQGAN